MSRKFDYFPDDEYEKLVVKEFDLMPSGERELHPHGTYDPVPGVTSLGWNKWKEEPAADFVKSLIDWQDGYVRDNYQKTGYNADDPIYRGELGLDDLKRRYSNQIASSSQMFEFEGLAALRAHLMGAREVRDLIRRHYYEECGHNEMLVDFMVGAFGMDRVNEVYPLQNPLNWSTARRKKWEMIERLGTKGHFVELAATNMLWERSIPKHNRMQAYGLRKHYKIPNKFLMFFDIHSYIDIYHSRYGMYILSKYCTTKELQEKAESAFKEWVSLSDLGVREGVQVLQVDKR
ncbi:MAG: iron-containing redox enzyme family protein [Nitrososphaerales archaeon]